MMSLMMILRCSSVERLVGEAVENDPAHKDQQSPPPSHADQGSGEDAPPSGEAVLEEMVVGGGVAC